MNVEGVTKTVLQLSLRGDDLSEYEMFVLGQFLARDDEYRITVLGDLRLVMREELPRVPDPFLVLLMDFEPVDGDVDRLHHLRRHDRPDQRTLGQRPTRRWAMDQHVPPGYRRRVL